MAKYNISMKKNMLLMLIYRAFVTVAPLITTPYICRVLSPESLGDYGYTQSICAYFSAFAALGTSIYGQREIAFIRDDEHKRSKLFWEILFFRMATTATSTIVYIAVLDLLFSKSFKVFFLIQIMDLISGLLDISWLYIGLERFSKVFIKNALLKMLSIACIFMFVKNETHIYLYVIINSLAIMVSNIAFWVDLGKYVGRVAFSELEYKKHISAIITLFLPSIAAVIYNKVDMTMLGYINKDSVDIAYYQQTLKITTICSTTISTISGVIAPRLAYVFSNKGREELNRYFIKGLDALCLIGIPVSFGLFSIAGSFIPQFLGNKYLPTIEYLRIMSPLCFVAGINNYVGAQYLVTTKRQNKYTGLVLAGTIVNIICNAIVIRTLGGIGALIASIVSESVILIAGLWITRKDFQFADFMMVLPKKLIAGGVMCSVVLFMSYRFSVSIINVFVEMIIGAAIYTALLLVMQDSMMLGTCQALLGRIRRK